MSDVKLAYGTTAQTLTCTLASLASAAARESTAVDNRTNKFLDVLVQLKIKSAAAAVSATGYVAVYAYGTTDDGTTYSDTASGTDAAITLTSPPNARLIGIINVVANATTYEGPPMSVASAFGGVLPAFWGVIVSNQSGAALDATEGNHAKLWQGVYATVV